MASSLPMKSTEKAWSPAQKQALCFLPERIPWHEDLQRMPQTSLLFSGLPDKGLVAFRPGSGSQELVQGRLLRRGHRLEGSRSSWQRTRPDCAQGNPSICQSSCGSDSHLGGSKRWPKTYRFQCFLIVTSAYSVMMGSIVKGKADHRGCTKLKGGSLCPCFFFFLIFYKQVFNIPLWVSLKIVLKNKMIT